PIRQHTPGRPGADDDEVVSVGRHGDFSFGGGGLIQTRIQLRRRAKTALPTRRKNLFLAASMSRNMRGIF
ncbi:MAG: hypothetical protein OXU96_05185, partial [Gammaproteobacteria bacterium]|nr:hypothetical protein [Gammaproteobacteria bacterium]